MQGKGRKFIYLITSPNDPSFFKCGETMHPLKRLSQFKTFSPRKDIAFTKIYECDQHISDKEHIHPLLEKHFAHQVREWFRGSANDAAKILDAQTQYKLKEIEPDWKGSSEYGVRDLSASELVRRKPNGSETSFLDAICPHSFN